MTILRARLWSRLSALIGGVEPEPASRREPRIAFWLLVPALCLTMAGCGSMPRPEGPFRFAPEEIAQLQDTRLGANDIEALRAFSRDLAARLVSSETHTILALSGGGANGAFGAGVIVGWTQSGDRPRFDVVTGVSTGALTAPFAFLGPDWDDELMAAYTDGRTDGLLSPGHLAILRGPSLFSASALRALVNESVTLDLLTAIAAEHAAGRTLLIATTNLDTQETVIWNMGLLATQGEAALPLFRDVLVASASIPGVFPPVLIPGTNEAGQVVMEMHVDGGVNTPFLAIPEELLMWNAPRDLPGDAHLYILLNGQLGRNTGVTPGRLGDILARTFDSVSKAQARQSLAANAAFASRNGLTLSLAAIPDDVSVSSLRFDTESMQALFELGRSRSVSGQAWGPVALAEAPASAVTPEDPPQTP